MNCVNCFRLRSMSWLLLPFDSNFTSTFQNCLLISCLRITSIIPSLQVNFVSGFSGLEIEFPNTHNRTATMHSDPCTSSDCSPLNSRSASDEMAIAVEQEQVIKEIVQYLDYNQTLQQSINQQTIMIWVCVVGYVISTLLCLGSLYVFKHFKWVLICFNISTKLCLFFRKLWCLRNGIHANFIGCIAMHNICWLILAACITVGLEICLLTEALVEITKFCVTSTYGWTQKLLN